VTEMKALTDGVTEDEILSAKAQLKAGLLRCLESTSSRSEQIARQMLIFGRVLATKELVENVNAVDKNAVNKIAARILNGPISLVGIGDMGGVPTLAKVQESFFRS
ncbi:MAG: insulinase family protein, partial [Proteobacteria bacterium]|nr:insulinase family protein [Pseudomonadota bacterium]